MVANQAAANVPTQPYWRQLTTSHSARAAVAQRAARRACSEPELPLLRLTSHVGIAGVLSDPLASCLGGSVVAARCRNLEPAALTRAELHLGRCTDCADSGVRCRRPCSMFSSPWCPDAVARVACADAAARHVRGGQPALSGDGDVSGGSRCARPCSRAPTVYAASVAIALELADALSSHVITCAPGTRPEPRTVLLGKDGTLASRNWPGAPGQFSSGRRQARFSAARSCAPLRGVPGPARSALGEYDAGRLLLRRERTTRPGYCLPAAHASRARRASAAGARLGLHHRRL